jgi:rhamnose utilization protein RhaD (predicted bifunctional aldolase and dehydrogenase)/NAD(P)-dependent dehydrogenase (short-subunit alcohol dehydrogenase family)
MQDRWSDEEAARFVSRYGEEYGEDVALRTYASRLIGSEKELVLHGGGNTSVKGTWKRPGGEEVPALFIKASGRDLANIDPAGHVALDLAFLMALRSARTMSDEEVMNELTRALFDTRAPSASLEALMHAFIPARFVDHTHPDAILVLTNQERGKRLVEEALGKRVLVLDYARPGFELAKSVADALADGGDREGIVLLKHGLVTWGDSARESYAKTIALVNKAEAYLEKHTRPIQVSARTSIEEARRRYVENAPMIRGAVAEPTGDEDVPYNRFVLEPIITEETLAFLQSEEAEKIVATPPLTADHLIRVKPFPLFIKDVPYDRPDEMKRIVVSAIEDYAGGYEAYISRHADRMPRGVKRFDARPRVIFMRGLGAVCVGRDAHAARIASDITERTVAAKVRSLGLGKYEGLSEEHLFDMEYYPLQHAKLARSGGKALEGTVALVTGAAGAIGSGITEALLAEGAHVVAADLAGERLDSLAGEMADRFPGRVIGVDMDVTSEESVSQALLQVVEKWGGIDLVVVNAGLAHVSSIAEMDLEAFRRLEKVNVEGCLNTIAASARVMEKQGTGGDIVLVSTKNVFAPGAKFGAYSATKAAAHQLARVASLELAAIGVRVNMVSPDAVFSHGGRRSGLWEQVGPDRMKARGLDEKGLEDYYRGRNLLKARVTASHVANAVLFFATRRTPTTGAVLPVDGGLPDATPR